MLHRLEGGHLIKISFRANDDNRNKAFCTDHGLSRLRSTVGGARDNTVVRMYAHTCSSAMLRTPVRQKCNVTNVTYANFSKSKQADMHDFQFGQTFGSPICY